MSPATWRRSFVRRAGMEDGFTVMEVSLAVALVLGILVAFSYVTMSSLAVVALGREKQSADALAQQTMEQVRALPFATVIHGLDDVDLTTAPLDPAITSAGSTYTYKGETIPHGTNTPANYTQAPLVPHRSTKSVNNILYSIAAYPTLAAGTPAGTVRMTVVVTWTASARQGIPHTVSLQSLFFQPTGCATGAGHPYVAPCQPFHYATAAVTPGHLTVTGTNKLGPTNSDLLLTSAGLNTASAESNIQAEQVTADNGVVTAAGGSMTLGTTTSTAGSTQGTVHADNDPSTPNLVYGSATLAAQSSGVLPGNDGDGNGVTVSTSAGDTGAAQAAAVANSINMCPDLANIIQTDGQACGAGTVKQAGTESITALVKGEAVAFPVATVSAQATKSAVFASKDAAADGTYCATTSGDGCVTAHATRYFGAITLGGLPAGYVPAAGWTGSLVQISAYSDTVGAESGIGTAAPTLAVNGSPTIKVWNGTGYTTVTITSATPAGPLPVAATTTASNNGMSVTLTASLTTGGETLTDPANCGGACTRTSASAVAGSPILGSIMYTFTKNGVTNTLTLAIDLGKGEATTSYQTSPSIAP